MHEKKLEMVWKIKSRSKVFKRNSWANRIRMQPFLTAPLIEEQCTSSLNSISICSCSIHILSRCFEVWFNVLNRLCRLEKHCFKCVCIYRSLVRREIERERIEIKWKWTWKTQTEPLQPNAMQIAFIHCEYIISEIKTRNRKKKTEKSTKLNYCENSFYYAPKFPRVALSFSRWSCHTSHLSQTTLLLDCCAMCTLLHSTPPLHITCTELSLM